MYAHKYVENDVNNKSPVELVRLLYSKAIERLHRAAEYDRAGQLPERNDSIAKTMQIVVELQGSLNLEEGGEIAANLARLYEYMQDRLSNALAAQNSATAIEEVTRPLNVLYDAWKDCDPETGPDAESTPAQPRATPADRELEPAPAGPADPEYVHSEPPETPQGRVWTL